MSERIRQIMREAFATANYNIDLNKNFFAQEPRKPSNLGVMELKATGLDDLAVPQAIEELRPFLADIGIKFVSYIEMSGVLVLTVTKENADEAERLCKKFGFNLMKVGFSSDGVETNPLKRQNDPTAPSPATKHFSDYGRSSQDGRGSAGSAGMIGGQGFPINRLAGE